MTVLAFLFLAVLALGLFHLATGRRSGVINTILRFIAWAADPDKGRPARR